MRWHAIALFKLPMDSAVVDSVYSLLHPFLLFSSSLIPFGEKSILLGSRSKCCSGEACVSGGGQEELIKSGTHAALDGEDMGPEMRSSGLHLPLQGVLYKKTPKSTVIG